MLRKAIVLFLLVVVLCVSGCATSSAPQNAAFGTCAAKMDVRYCGEGN